MQIHLEVHCRHIPRRLRTGSVLLLRQNLKSLAVPSLQLFVKKLQLLLKLPFHSLARLLQGSDCFRIRDRETFLTDPHASRNRSSNRKLLRKLHNGPRSPQKQDSFRDQVLHPTSPVADVVLTSTPFPSCSESILTSPQLLRRRIPHSMHLGMVSLPISITKKSMFRAASNPSPPV